MSPHSPHTSVAGPTRHQATPLSMPQQDTMPPGLASVALDALPDTIAVLDPSGTIVAVNAAWIRFADDNGAPAFATGIGINYLAVCRAAANDEIAQQVYEGLSAILAGAQHCFMLEYPCHSPTVQRWYLLRAMPAPGDKAGAIVVHSNITARKLDEAEQTRLYEAAQAAERATTQQAQQLEAVLAAIPDGFVVVDRQGHVVRTSAFDQAFVGSAHDGEPVEERARRLNLRGADGAPLPAERIPAVRVLHGEVLTANRPANIYAYTPDGRRIELSVTGDPIRDASGRSAGGVLIYRDVTRERRALRRYQATIEMAPDATVVADRDGCIQLVNRQTEALFGYTREELLGQPVERLIPERFHPGHGYHRAECAAAPSTRPMGANLRLFGRRRDGSEFPVEVSLASLREEKEGQLIISIRDVSEVQRGQAANRELRRLLALTDTAVSHLDQDALLPDLLGRVHDVMQVDNVAILLLDKDGQNLRVWAARGPEEEAAAGVRVPLGQGFAGRIAASHAPLIVEDLSRFPVVSPFLREQLCSAVGVPLELRDRVLGALHVGTVKPCHFTEQDVQLLERAAERVAVAIERAQLFEAEQHARQEAEAALARALASETRFQRLVDSGIIGILIGDGVHVLDANDAYLQMLGYTREDLQAGALTRQVLVPSDRETVAATERAIGEARAIGTCQPFEREYIRKDGSRVPVFIGMALLQQEPPLFVSFVVDLTERKRAERVLRESEERLRLFIEYAPAAVAMFDNEMRYVSASRRWMQDYGLAGDILGRRHYDLFPETPARWKAIHRRCLAGAIEKSEEDTFERPDGSIQWLKWEVRPWYSGPGEIGGIIIFAEDITERKRLEREREEALRNREEWFRTMADTAPVLLWVAGPDGLVTFLNAPWLQFTGRSLERELGNGWAEGVHPDDHQRCLETYLAAFHARQPFAMEYRLRRFDGEYRWLLDNGVPRYAPDGAFLGYIGSAIDITEREQLEREREAAQAGELAAQAVARQMDQFFATAAHDIRSPVTAVSGFVQMAHTRATQLVGVLQEQDGKPADLAARLAATLETAEASTDRLTRMTNLLFDVARARSGTFTVSPAPCDLGDLVREQVEAQRQAAPTRTIHLDLPGDEPITVTADADRIGQVLTNFVGNALKYTPGDQPVEVGLYRGKGHVRVTVRDHGPGLPPEEQVRVWEVFHRAPGIEVQGNAGAMSGSLGLGLHICKRIMELHPGGQIGVESQVGTGSTFWFELPVANGGV